MFRQIARGLSIAAALALPFAATAQHFEGKLDGAYMSLEAIEVDAYGEPAYMEYLGHGYIPLLAKVKAEGIVLDYGVLQSVTGRAGDGNVFIWWTVASMGDLEKANIRIDELAATLHAESQWREMVLAAAKFRVPVSTEIMREVTWTEVVQEDEAEAEE